MLFKSIIDKYSEYQSYYSHMGFSRQTNLTDLSDLRGTKCNFSELSQFII